MRICGAKMNQEIPSGFIPKWCPFSYNKISDLILAFHSPMKINSALSVSVLSEKKNVWRNRNFF